MSTVGGQMERLRSIELRMSEIRAKTSSLGVADAGKQFRDILQAETRSSGAVGNQAFGAQSSAIQSSYGQALSSAVGASAPYGALQPPGELVSWGNGRIPASLLESIGQGDHRLSRDAAAAFKAMAADARRDGVTLSVSDSYRSLDEQAAMVESQGRYGEGGLAAEPGTSAHGWGLAVDLDLNGRATTWMRANAARYGFAEDVPREPWHWTYRATAAGRTTATTKGLL
ncbi:MAG: M15 family metallopeptidase [Acidimicrobiales bacterium]